MKRKHKVFRFLCAFISAPDRWRVLFKFVLEEYIGYVLVIALKEIKDVNCKHQALKMTNKCPLPSAVATLLSMSMSLGEGGKGTKW